MKISTIGRGAVGGGLARRWEKAGHRVTTLGHEGGDAADADAVLIAVPSVSLSDALSRVSGLAGKIAIEASNACTGRDEKYESLAHQVKAHTKGPVAKAFNLNYAALYDRIDQQRVAPSDLYAADEEACTVAEQLIRDAGYQPVSVGGLDKARGLEDILTGVYPIMEQAVFYHFAAPGEL